MTLIKLTHANLKTPLYVACDLIAAFYLSPGNQCTHVVSSGGAVLPVSESPDQITKLLGAVPINPGDKPKEK